MPESREFWRVFRAAHWEREPLVVDHVPGGVPLGAEALFDSAVRACSSSWYLQRRLRDVASYYLLNRRDTRDQMIGVRFMVEDRELWRRTRHLLAPVVRRELLPRQEDGGFAGYYARITRLLNSPARRRLGMRKRRFALVINNLELVDPDLWAWMREFLRGLYREIGMNHGGAYFALFVGDYSRTAFGVHDDPESVFSLPIIGPKAIRTWPSSYVARHPELRGRVLYDEFASESTLHEAEPGGFIYWPSDRWHIAENAGGLSVSLALGLLVRPSATDSADGPDPKTVPFDSDDVQRSAEVIPHELRVPAGRSAGEHWLRLVTSMGCLYPPEAREERVTLDDAVQRAEGALVARVRTAAGHLLVGMNGHVWTVPGDPEVEQVLDTLASGRAARVCDLMKLCEGSTVRSQVADLVQRAYAVRGISKLVSKEIF